MNYDQVTGLVRTLIPAIFAYAVGKGYIAEGAVTDITAAAVAVVAAVWSVINNKTGKTIQPGIVSKS